jgi:hypothetical protein
MTHEVKHPDAASEVLVDLEACLCQAEASKQWFDRKVLPLTVKDLRWRPGPQAWSIGQYLDHLNLTLALYLPRVNDAIASASPAESATPPLPLGAASEIQAIRLIEPPGCIHLCTPAETVPPAATDPDQLVDGFYQNRDRYADTVRRAFGIDLTILIPDPMIPPIRTVGGTLAFLAAHDRGHIWQAQWIRRALAGDLARAQAAGQPRRE